VPARGIDEDVHEAVITAAVDCVGGKRTTAARTPLSANDRAIASDAALGEVAASSSVARPVPAVTSSGRSVPTKVSPIASMTFASAAEATSRGTLKS